MDHSELANQLLSAKSKRQRLSLAEANESAREPELARKLKDICVENWAAAPKMTRKAALVLKELEHETDEPAVTAFSHWAGGIAEMTHGRLESAVEKLDSASRIFATAGWEYESAQPQIAILVALAMLGLHERIQSAGRRALKVLEKYGDDLSAGKVEINLSNVASRLGRHREAEKFGLSAYYRFKKVKAKSWQAMAENGLAITYTELNDFRNAERFFNAALRSAQQTGAGVTEAEVEASIGNLELFRGRYAEALRSLEMSRQKFEKLGMPHKTAVAELEIAEIYAELNLTTESSQLFTASLSKLSRLRMPAEKARAFLGLGRLAAQRGDRRVAENYFAKALEIFTSERNKSGIATVLLSQALMEHSMGRWDSAGKLASRAGKAFAGVGSERQRLMAAWLLADSRCRAGGRDIEALEGMLAEARSAGQTPVTLLILNSIGTAHIGEGNIRAAKDAFRRAATIIAQSRSPLSGEEFRVAFLAARLEPFEALARLAISEKSFTEAFCWVEAARARSLLENTNSQHTLELSPEYRASREQLNWAYHRLREATGDDAKKLQADVKRLEKRISDILRRRTSTERRATENRSKLHGEFDLPGLQKDLGGRILVEYVSSQGRLSAFVVTASEVSYFPDLCSTGEVAALLEELRFQFGALRYGRAGVSSFLGQMKLRTDTALKELYQLLVEPLEAKIDSRNLVVIPSGTVHYVPFSALRRGTRYLVEDRSVTVAPSASVWRSMERRPVKKLRKALLAAFADDAAPLVEDEVSAISKVIPEPVVLAGANATVTSLATNAGGMDLIHFACHGQFRADNPLYSSLQLADGNITVRDISSLNLAGASVTLSACETGLNEVLPGEEIIGLARGFISAGVRSMLLTLWTVNDEATRQLMVEFYSNLQRGNSYPASLRLVQLKFIENGEHPYYWSPFFTIG